MLILEILNEDKWLDDYKFFKDFKNSSYYETLLDTYQNLNTDILYKSHIHGQGHIERVILLLSHCSTTGWRPSISLSYLVHIWLN